MANTDGDNNEAQAMASATSIMGLVNKIPMFNGNTNELPVKQFIEQVEIISKIGNWTPETIIAIAKICTLGEARLFISNCPLLHATESWSEFRSALIARFAPKQAPSVISRSFYSCVQRAGESVDAYVSRLHTIGSQLFDKSDNAEELRIQNKMLDQRLLDQLLEGLLPVLRRPVLNADPRTFEEGINTAKKSERIERQLGSLDSEQQEFVRYSDTRDTAFHVTQNPSTSQVRTREFNNGTRDSNITVKTKATVAREDTRMCFKCENIGHIARFCKAQQRPRDETVPTCSRCKCKGHRLAECKVKKQNLNSSQPSVSTPTSTA